MGLIESVNGAVSASTRHCVGFLVPGASADGYIVTMKLSIGCVSVAGLTPGLSEIVAYDDAERQDAYIGQTNMIGVSSFCGPTGALWGYDLAKAPDLHAASNHITTARRHDGRNIDVWKLDPLLDATVRLFGTTTQRRFPPLPGSMVPCAYKSKTATGPTDIWCAMGLAIAEDRGDFANLFVEDANASEGGAPADPLEVIEAVVEAVLACGGNEGATYREIFVGVKFLRGVPSGDIACALTCAPYVTLAQGAIPANMEAGELLGMSIGEWESSCRSQIAHGMSTNRLRRAFYRTQQAVESRERASIQSQPGVK